MKKIINKIPLLNNLARYVYRAIQRQKKIRKLKTIRDSSPLRIVIGASGVYEQGWVDTDAEYLNLLNSKHWKSCFRKNSIDAILAEHVWEHLTLDEGFDAAKRCFEYLKPGGYLRVAVPDGGSPNQSYIDQVKPGGSGAGADDHKVLYSHITFSDVLKKAGFNIDLLEYFDSQGDFQFKDWNPEDGKINRSKRFDQRNQDGKLNYTSLIIDAYKP